MNSAAKPTILFLTDSLRMGGIEQLVVRWTRARIRTGFRVEAAVLHGGGVLEAPLRELGVPVHALDKRDGLDWRLVLRLRRLILERRIDVIHTNDYAPWLYAVLAASFTRARIVHTEHAKVHGELWRRYMLEKALSLASSAVVAVSRSVHDAMRDHAHISPGKLRVIANGVDMREFQGSAARRASMRAALAFAPTHCVFGTVGRLVPVKNQAALLRAFARISAQLPEARLLIVGDGPLHGDLAALIASLGIAARARLAGQRADIADLLNAFDVFALPSDSEGMSVSLLEAMAAGLPAVATAVGGNSELVRPGETGLLVPVGDVAALAQAMRTLALDPGARERMGTRARQVCGERFSQDAMLAEYDRLYCQT